MIIAIGKEPHTR